jgi:hypothetical protein
MLTCVFGEVPLDAKRGLLFCPIRSSPNLLLDSISSSPVILFPPMLFGISPKLSSVRSFNIEGISSNIESLPILSAVVELRSHYVPDAPCQPGWHLYNRGCLSLRNGHDVLRRQNPLFALPLQEEAFLLRSPSMTLSEQPNSMDNRSPTTVAFTLRVHPFSHHVKKIGIIHHKMIDIRLLSQ